MYTYVQDNYKLLISMMCTFYYDDLYRPNGWLGKGRQETPACANHTQLTRISQLECFLGLDEIVPIIFETSELPFKDRQHIGSIIRSKVTL